MNLEQVRDRSGILGFASLPASSPPHSQERQPLIGRRFRPVTSGRESYGGTFSPAMSAMRSKTIFSVGHVVTKLAKTVRWPAGVVCCHAACYRSCGKKCLQ